MTKQTNIYVNPNLRCGCGHALHNGGLDALNPNNGRFQITCPRCSRRLFRVAFDKGGELIFDFYDDHQGPCE